MTDHGELDPDEQDAILGGVVRRLVDALDFCAGNPVARTFFSIDDVQFELSLRKTCDD